MKKILTILFMAAVMLTSCSKENEVVQPVAPQTSTKTKATEKTLGFQNRPYIIRSASYPKVIDVAWGACNTGQNLHLWDYHGGWNQQWYITPSGDGTGSYYIRSACGKYLDLAWGLCKNGQYIHLWDFNGGAAQKWYIYPSIDGYFHIVSACGKYLDAAGFTPFNGQRLQIYQYNGGYWNQKWYFHPA